MPGFVELILGVYGIIGISVVVLLSYLIFRRIRLKKEEDFEDRDN